MANISNSAQKRDHEIFPCVLPVADKRPTRRHELLAVVQPMDLRKERVHWMRSMYLGCSERPGWRASKLPRVVQQVDLQETRVQFM